MFHNRTKVYNKHIKHLQPPAPTISSIFQCSGCKCCNTAGTMLPRSMAVLFLLGVNLLLADQALGKSTRYQIDVA